MFPGVKGIGNRKGRMELLLGGLLRLLRQRAVAARKGKADRQGQYQCK